MAVPDWNKHMQTTNAVTEPDPEPTCSKCGQVLQTLWDDTVKEIQKELQELADEFVANAVFYEMPRIRKPAPVRHRRTSVNKRHRAIRLARKCR